MFQGGLHAYYFCWRGYKGADAAIKAGYKNVNWFRDGLPAWKEKKYPTK